MRDATKYWTKFVDSCRMCSKMEIMILVLEPVNIQWQVQCTLNPKPYSYGFPECIYISPLHWKDLLDPPLWIADHCQDNKGKNNEDSKGENLYTLEVAGGFRQNMWMGKCGNRAPGWVDGKYSLLLPVGKFWWELVCCCAPTSGTRAPSKYLHHPQFWQINQAALKQTELLTFSSNSLWTDIIASANLNPRSSAGNWSWRLCPSRNIRCTSNTRAEPMGLRLLRKAGDTWARPIAKRPSKSVTWNLSGSNSPTPLFTTLCTNLQTE